MESPIHMTYEGENGILISSCCSNIYVSPKINTLELGDQKAEELLLRLEEVMEKKKYEFNCSWVWYTWRETLVGEENLWWEFNNLNLIIKVYMGYLVMARIF